MRVQVAIFVCVVGSLASACVGLEIEAIPTGDLATNQAALDAFDRAASIWENVFTDDIIVSIETNFDEIAEGFGGFATPSIVGTTNIDGFDAGSVAVLIDAQDEPGDAIVNSLPTFQQLNVTMQEGALLAEAMVFTRANAKALGVNVPGDSSDGTISFQPPDTIPWDFDSRDGIEPGTFDFETVAAHEIAHILGFWSIVEAIEQDLVPPEAFGDVVFFPFDLFRFSSEEGLNPSTPEEFKTFPRNVLADTPVNFDDIDNEYPLATGSITGDGDEASHFKSLGLGYLMEPGFAEGEIRLPTAADLRVLDLIGYEYEPEEICMLGDADCDGDVDTADQTIVISNWTGALEMGIGDKLFEDGDFDADGDVDTADRTVVVVNWTGAQQLAEIQSLQSTLNLTSIPEPSSMLLMAFAAIALLSHRPRQHTRLETS